MINYHKRRFKPIHTSANGATSSETIFYYHQEGNILTAEYSGGKIIKGHLIGIVDQLGNIDMRYHQVDDEGVIMTGKCQSVPEVLDNGKIRLHESWEWTSGDYSKGNSILEES